jgi:DNA-directed RNA polymerase III subunit RPC4
LREERLYFFQFPCPFPRFKQESGFRETENSGLPNDTSKNLVSTKDVKTEQTPSKDAGSSKEQGSPHHAIDGIIGQLEMYRSGAVKMRLANGILLDVRVLFV